MSTVVPAANAAPETVIVAPFGIQADHPRNCDIMIQSIPGTILRGGIKPTSTTVQGQIRTPQLGTMNMPTAPGMEIHVNPAMLTYVIVDSLSTDVEAKNRILRYLKTVQGGNPQVNPVPTIHGELDESTMKTLCRELRRIVDAKEARSCKGPLPELAQIDKLPGEYLLNPGSVVPNTQPRYERDMHEWVAQLNRSGA